jgi:periodic tryptophan protein 1
MITATTWVPRGFAAPFPEKYQFDEDEYERISQLAKLQLDDAKEDLEEAQAEKKDKSSGKSKSKDHEYVWVANSYIYMY